MSEYFDPSECRFRGLPVVLGNTALVNSRSLNMLSYDILVILEGGVDCSKSRRRANIVERCAFFGGKWIKVVAKHDFHTKHRIECWLIVHLDED